MAMLIRVVLPAPFFPSKPTTSPGSGEKLTPWSTSTPRL
jgi:hypothetical protein